MKHILALLNLSIAIIFLGLFVYEQATVVQANGPVLLEVDDVGDFDGIGPGSGFLLLGRSGLDALADFVNRGSGLITSGVQFVLLSDGSGSINGSGLVPIGHINDYVYDYMFHGVFDGQNVTIINLQTSPYTDNIIEFDGVGLFGATKGASIANVTISGTTVLTGVDHIGSLIGISYDTTIQGVRLNGDVSITGTNNLGGLIGSLEEDSVLQSSSLYVGVLSIQGNNRIGGLIGFTYYADVAKTSLHATTMQLNASNSIGGFVGLSDSDSLIVNSYLAIETATLSASGSNIGGFAGFNNGQVHHGVVVSNLLTLSGQNNGGFVGFNDGGTIKNSSIITSGLNQTGNISGGFVGYNAHMIQSSEIIANHVESTSTVTWAWIAGFVSLNEKSVTNSRAVIKSISLLNLSSTPSGGLIGGFASRNRSGGSPDTAILSNSTLVYDELLMIGDVTDPYIGENFGTISNSGIYAYPIDEPWYSDFNYVSGEFDSSSIIDADYFITVLNSGLSEPAWVIRTNNEYFPVLSGLSEQPETMIYWFQSSTPNPTTNDPQDPDPVPTTLSPSTSKPLVLELVVDAIDHTIEVGSSFELPYEAYTLFGYIKTDVSSAVVVEGSFDPNVVGAYPFRLTVSAEGLSSEISILITVVDLVPPLINGPTHVRLFVGEVYESLLTVTDNVDFTPSLLLLTPLDTSTAGTTEVIWQATDASGNASTFTQTVEVVVPAIRVETVTINNQTFIFSITEVDYNLPTLRVEYVVSVSEPTNASPWQVLSGQPTVKPGERVFVRLNDGVNTSDVRQTIVIPEPVTIIEDVVYPVVEPSSQTNVALIGVASLAGVASVAGGWWFLAGKKRKQDKSET